ncbi:uncharacterized protein LOC123987955 [Osmia bicornis bicornis]|uniref:uncharacterized protein LOC123987955 n=1 Tax=Osmia bicornis bicornis TaxID=1437191 RepID=UPI001EAEDC12|nr:uncharacterized protein LOC123987955 [Osmia bicornis bicornis]
MDRITTLLLFIGLAMNLDASDDVGITTFEQNTGLYFEKLPPLKIYHIQWRLVTSIEIKNYLRHRPMLDEHLHQIEMICKDHNFTNCPSQLYGQQLRDTLAQTDRYSDLLKAFTGDIPKEQYHRIRIRRSAPLSFIGTISKVLFGTLTEDDAHYYNQELDKLYTGQGQMAEIIANQTYIMRSEFDNLHAQLLNTTLEAHFIMNEVITLGKELHKTQTEIKGMEIRNLLLGWTDQLDKAIQEYHSSLIIIIDAILFAKQGTLHPAILSPQQLLDAARKIMDSTTYEFPLTPTEILSEQFSGIAKFHVTYTKGRILFELIVPLLDTTVYDLYKVHSSPITQVKGTTTLTVFIKPSTPYLAVAMNGITYVTPDEEYIRQCYNLHGHYICQATIPIAYLRNKPTCETELLSQTTMDSWNMCDVRLTPTFKDLWQPLLYKQDWLFYVKEGKKIYFYCRDRSAGSQYIQGTGILKLKPGCTAITDSTRIRALDTIESTEEFTYAPTISLDITRILPDFGDHHVEAIKQLTNSNISQAQPTNNWPKNEATISLMQLEEKARTLAEHHKTRHPSTNMGPATPRTSIQPINQQRWPSIKDSLS